MKNLNRSAESFLGGFRLWCDLEDVPNLSEGIAQLSEADRRQSILQRAAFWQVKKRTPKEKRLAFKVCWCHFTQVYTYPNLCQYSTLHPKNMLLFYNWLVDYIQGQRTNLGGNGHGTLKQFFEQLLISIWVQCVTEQSRRPENHSLLVRSNAKDPKNNMFERNISNLNMNISRKKNRLYPYFFQDWNWILFR